MSANCCAKTPVPAADKPQELAEGALPLCALRAGQKARVVGVVGHCDQVLRLSEFGLRPGVEVQMLRPGQASIIRLGAAKVCFRPPPGLSVLVKPDGQ